MYWKSQTYQVGSGSITAAYSHVPQDGSMPNSQSRDGVVNTAVLQYLLQYFFSIAISTVQYFLVKVNSRSRSLYAIVRPSVCRL